jgi:hypothetical protein
MHVVQYLIKYVQTNISHNNIKGLLDIIVVNAGIGSHGRKTVHIKNVLDSENIYPYPYPYPYPYLQIKEQQSWYPATYVLKQKEVCTFSL